MHLEGYSSFPILVGEKGGVSVRGSNCWGVESQREGRVRSVRVLQGVAAHSVL